MSRYQTPDNFNTGSIAAGASGTFDRTITASICNIVKIKVVPSGSTVGYKFEIYKKDTYLAADRLFATKEQVQGSFYAPTDRSGNEVLEGFVIPYEDLDASTELHIKITNHDSVARSFQVTITYDLSGVSSFFSSVTGLTGNLKITGTSLDTIQDIQVGSTPTFVGAHLSGLTLGSVLFSGASGLITQDNGGLFYNPITHDLMVGHNTDTSIRLYVLDQYAKDANLSGGNHDVACFGSANGAAASDLVLALRVGPDPTPANRYMSIQAYEHGVGGRALRLQDSGGFVGIGQGAAIPLSNLLTVKDSLTDSEVTLIHNTNSSVGHNFGLQVIGGTSAADYALRVRQAVSPFTEGLAVDGAGNVGIGTITPSLKLQVVGSVGVSAGHLSFFTSGATPETAAGQIRGQHGFSMYAKANDGTTDVSLLRWGFGSAGTDQLSIGYPSTVTYIQSSLATPSSPSDGDWWVECVGTSPARVCAIKVRDAGSTRTIASLTY